MTWLEFWKQARELLASVPIVGALGPYGQLTLALWGASYWVRKYRPEWWAWMLRLGPDPEGALLHFVQVAPGAILGAAFAGATTGDIEQAAWGLLCGPVAALWHHLVKLAPVPYQGALNDKATKLAKALKAGGVSLVLLTLTGCTVPLEKARTAGLSERTTGAGEDPTPYCQSLDRARANWGAVAKGAAVASGASGISTIPLGDEHETIAASTAAGLAVVGGVAFYMSEQKASQWARDCSER